MAQKLPTQTPDSSSSQKMIGDLQVFHQSADGASEANNLSKSPTGSSIGLETLSPEN